MTTPPSDPTTSLEHEEAGRPTRTLRYHSTAGARPLSAGGIVLVGLIAFGLAGLLNADSLYATASRQPFGWKRTVTRQLVAPLRSISHATGLSRPRASIQRAIGRDPEAGTRTRSRISVTAPVTSQPPPGAPRRHRPRPHRRGSSRRPIRSGSGSEVIRWPRSSAARCSQMAGGRDNIKAELDYRISTGLTRPDYFDWPAHLHDEVLPKRPELIVIMFGANDAQPMEVDGAPFKVRSPQWRDEYRKRVALTMDLLAGDGRVVFWVGQPRMRSAEFDERMHILNEIYRSEAASRPWVRFVDSGPVLAPPTGGYAAYLPGSDGQPQLARSGDGIHLTRFGANRLAAAVLDRLDQELAGHAGVGAAWKAEPPRHDPGGEASPNTSGAG